MACNGRPIEAISQKVSKSTVSRAGLMSKVRGTNVSEAIRTPSALVLVLVIPRTRT